jgi:hypothetical protein
MPSLSGTLKANLELIAEQRVKSDLSAGYFFIWFTTAL